MKTFKLTVSTPDGNAFSGECVSISVRGTEGELCVMAGHAPFVTGVVKAPVTIVLETGEEKVGYAEGGVLTVGGTETVFIAGSFRFE